MQPPWNRLAAGEILCHSVAPISVMSDRQRAEAAMINHHKPPCNVEWVNEFAFDTTVIVTSGKNTLMTATFTVHAKSRWAV